MDLQINMLLNTVPSEEKRPADQQQEYQMAKIDYSYNNNSYAFELIDWPEEERRGVMKETKPHTLRSGVSRSVTVNDRLYVLH